MRGGPHAGADHGSAESHLRAAAARHGAHAFHATEGPTFMFEVEAPSAGAAMKIVTDLFRRVYGRHWWAQVVSAYERGR